MSSLQGAKGLLINITGGNDLTLFEDQSVNKIRAEVDPEAELIFQPKDESMTGKITSIVAQLLMMTENKTVLNMFSRVQNRNSALTIYFLESKNENNTLSSIDGATALN